LKIPILCFAIAAVSLLIIFCQLLPLTLEAVQTLFTFNFLFLLILMPLKGCLARKITVLLVGNVLSFLWSTLLYLFVHVTVGQMEGFLRVIYAILRPLLNVLWVVAFWSTSLTFLTEKKAKSGEKLDNRAP
jgi:hypothetical protein